MGTAAGFFGITYQGAVNGLASVTLSIFNMVRGAASSFFLRPRTPFFFADLFGLCAPHRRTTPTTARG